MAVALRYATPSGNGASSGTGFTIAVAATGSGGPVNGDDCFVDVVSRDHLVTDAHPTCTDNESPSNPWTIVAQSTDRKATTFHKKATANTGGITVTCAAFQGASAGGFECYSGCHATTPLTNISVEDNAAANNTHASFTPDYADSMIRLSLFNTNNDNAFSAQSCTDPGALTERWEQLTTGGSDAAVAVASALATGGPSSTGSLTWTVSASDTGKSIAMALRPAVAGGGGAPTIVTVGTWTHGTGDIDPPNPTHVANDILLCVCETADPEAVDLPAGGWAEAPGSPIGQSVNGNTRLTAFWLRATGAGTAAPHLLDPGNHIGAQVYLIRGCVTAGSPFHKFAADVLTVSSTTGTIPGFVTTLVDCLVMKFIATGVDTASSQVSSPVNASLSSLTEQSDNWTTDGNGGGFACISGVRAAIGTVSPTTVTLATSGRQARLAFAFHPSGGAGGDGDPTQPHQFHMMELQNTPSAGPEVAEVELVIQEGEVGAPGSTIDNPAQMHPSVTDFAPTWVANWNNSGSPDGQQECDVMLCTTPAGWTPDIATDEARRRGDTFYDKDGQLVEGVVITDGATGVPLVRGTQRGVCSDGVPVLFDPPFQSVPEVDFLARGGITYEPRTAQWSGGTYDATKPQVEDNQALDLTSAGFTPALKLRQFGAVSTQSRNFAGTELIFIDDFDEASLATAGANDNIYLINLQYQARWQSANGLNASFRILYKIESFDGSIWQTRYNGATQGFSTNSTAFVTVTGNIPHTFSVGGLTSGDKFRITALGVQILSGNPTVDFTAGTGSWLKGRTGSPAGLVFTTATDLTATKTPSGFSIPWIARGYV